jgi:hypothetical protein
MNKAEILDKIYVLAKEDAELAKQHGFFAEVSIKIMEVFEKHGYKPNYDVDVSAHCAPLYRKHHED